MDPLRHLDVTQCASSSPGARPVSDGYHVSRIPSDIIHYILSLVEVERDCSPSPYHYTWTVLQPTLSVLCLLDRELNAAATHRIYKDVFIPSWRALSLFIRTLHERRELREHVRSFAFFRIRMEGSEQKYYLDYERGLEQVYALCPNIHFDTLDAPVANSWLYRDGGIIDAQRITHLRTKELVWISLETLIFSVAQTFLSDLSQILRPPPRSFPSLEELVIIDKLGSFDWPDMPRLRRLCLYHCSFPHPQRRVTLPKYSKGLRALEIVGGMYTSEGFWTEVDTFRASLEHLSLLSESFTMDFLTQGRLHKFPSLTSLRILATSSMGHERVPILLPSQVVHLVIVAGQYDDPLVTWNVEEAIRKRVKAKRKKHGRSRCRWESVLFAKIPDRHVRIDQKIIQIMAGQVGIRFTESFRRLVGSFRQELFTLYRDHFDSFRF